jgi:hypothetical protein
MIFYAVSMPSAKAMGKTSSTCLKGVTMKYLFCTLLLITSFLFICCDKEDSPVSGQTDNQKKISVYAYGSSLDSAYYKVWSDSSWEKFGQIVILNSIVYVTVVNSDGDEGYYSASGYSGIKPYGQSLILFDTPLTSLPDTLVFGQKYTRETTFSYLGYSYSLKIEQTLEDTVSVSVSFGTFNPCLWLTSTSTTSVGGQSNVSNGQIWLAIGPSDIQQALNTGITISMVYGNVNGRSWGTYTVQPRLDLSKKQNSFSLDRLIEPIISFLK